MPLDHIPIFIAGAVIAASGPLTCFACLCIDFGDWLAEIGAQAEEHS